jgi:hypothetical protein
LVRLAAWGWLAVLLLAAALPAAANEMFVEPRRVQLNDLVTITVSLEGDYASVESLYVPLQNLAVVGEASVSTEFAWINGDVRRRKTFRYRARPLAAGSARVGPLVLNADDGQRDTLPAIDVQVQPDRVAGSNDAEVVMRELLASGRDPLFVIAEIDKKQAWVGEPVTVTWWLYNAAMVQQWQIVTVPKLPEFWSEEQTRSETPERVFLGEAMVQRVPIRRAVLFPLQSGPVRIGGITVEASIMRRARRGPFAMFEGELVETTFTSAPLALDVKPIPPGAPVDAIGDFTLRCDAPLQKNGGPIVVKATLSGLGNVRAASPPRFTSTVAGTVTTEGGEVTVAREEGSFGMARTWRFLIFPTEAGSFEVPPLSMLAFVPSTGQRRELRCAGGFVNATTARAPLTAAPPSPPEPPPAKIPWSLIGGSLLLLLGALIAIPRIRRALKLRREVEAIVRDAAPAEIRARVEARMHVDLREPGERGDAWRALRSLLDAKEHDRDLGAGGEGELRRRVRELLEAAKR